MLQRGLCALRVLVAFASTGWFAEPAEAQTDPKGSWGPVIDWEYWIAERDPTDPSAMKIACPDANNPTQALGLGNKESEISHAALMSTGTYAGWVLFWRKELDPDNCNCSRNNRRLWAVDPSHPEDAVRIHFAFENGIFCAGQSWDRLGQLLIAGGITAGCVETETQPAAAYRFRPTSLGEIVYTYPLPTPPEPFFAPKVFQFLRAPVKQQGYMVIGRYYPTVMPLKDEESQFSSNLKVNGQSASGTIPAGVNLVLGGPPKLQAVGGGALAEGNEVWEAITTDTTTSWEWEHPFIPVDPTGLDTLWPTWTSGQGGSNESWDHNAPHYDETTPEGQLFGEPAGTYDTYSRQPANYPDRLLDSYPRAFQLTDGEILICGDVDTSASLSLGEPGATWVVDPDYMEASENGWESWRGPEGSGHVGGGEWHDSFYDSAVLLQTLDPIFQTRTYRVLMFGGSRYRPFSDTWETNTEMWEFNPDPFPPPGESAVVTGAWALKTTDTRFGRVFANAVVLPTGEILIVGGTYEDDFAGQGGHFEGATDPAEPIIYHPGPTQASGGTVFGAPVVPNTVEGTSTPILPRLYHSVAVLLRDGRVIAMGGKRKYDAAGNLAGPQLGISGEDPRHSGQIFTPPYLDFDNNGFAQRPVVDSVDSPILFDTAFNMTVIRDEDPSHVIDRVVLIRPGAVTHHFDQDQRYLELAFTSSGPVASGGDYVETLTVQAPDKNELPAGWYMIFAVERDTQVPLSTLGYRVPTVGEFVRIK
jgi:hypothetical protein